MHRRDLGNYIIASTAAAGAIVAAAYGFGQAGVGGAIVGIVLGTIAGAVAGGFLFVLLIDMLPFWILLAIVGAIVFVISALWGVGKP